MIEVETLIAKVYQLTGIFRNSVKSMVFFLQHDQPCRKVLFSKLD